MKVGLKQSVLSASVFVGILVALASVDARVRDRFAELITPGGIVPLTSQLADMGDALTSAMRSQTIENAPMVVFAAVSAVLVLFMFRT